ncbi:MAG: thiamine diphosphokinase [Sporolactobacillus sp.]|jgi:thiamine pyrophosphokinase|nr:thiamine diphosphokinase [Sporolactobacillus sp.]
MKLAIVAGGPEERIPQLDQSRYGQFKWIGADRGTYVLLRQHIRPSWAVGDFDSLSDKEKAAVLDSGIRLHRYPPEKDRTDLEIALDLALKKRPEKLLIFGATGGRIDHELAAVQLLLKAVRCGVECSIVDQANCITLLTPGIYHIRKDSDYPYLSFLSLSERVTGLTLRGVKYPLADAELPVGSSLCVSNEVSDGDGSVSFSTGYLLLMRCRD